MEARIRELCGELGLALDGKPVAKLSQGNRQKLHLARSLLHRPELLLWDEPTDHLDPASQRQVLQYLRSYLDDGGGTALVATHRLEQMVTVSSHFGFLSHGKLLRAGTRDEILGEEEGTQRARLGFARPLLPDRLSGFGSGLGFEIILITGTEAEISGRGQRDRLPAIIKALVAEDLPLASVEPLRPSLSDVYARWVKP
jgi:ABC-2 type transport system ATP-binding protein